MSVMFLRTKRFPLIHLGKVFSTPRGGFPGEMDWVLGLTKGRFFVHKGRIYVFRFPLIQRKVSIPRERF